MTELANVPEGSRETSASTRSGLDDRATIVRMPIDIADPRLFSATPDPSHDSPIQLAEASLAAPSVSRADVIDRTLTSALAARLLTDDTALLAGLFYAAPSATVARHLWRRLIDAWRQASAPTAGDEVVAMLFALPVVIVAGGTADAPQPALDALAGTLDDVDRVSELLRSRRALGGNLSFALGSQLVGTDALDIPRLPTLLRWQRLGPEDASVTRELPAAPMLVQPGQESVHLRFLIGTAIVGVGVDPFADAASVEWTMPLAQELSRQLARPGVSVLALPRPPQSPMLALQYGRSAQREVGVQLFASNAIRQFRARVGEPSAVISAHRCPAAPGGGELRLSLSSPFDPQPAKGFRCPLFAPDSASDVATMLVDLLHDCRVSDIRMIAGVQPDRAPGTGLPLLFRADAISDDAAVGLH